MSGMHDNKRGVDLHNHARMAKARAINLHPAGNLVARAILPRFSPTATFADMDSTEPSSVPDDEGDDDSDPNGDDENSVPLFTTSSSSSSATPVLVTSASSSSLISSVATTTSTFSSSSSSSSSSSISSAIPSSTHVEQSVTPISSPTTSVARVTQYTHTHSSSSTSSAIASSTAAPTSNASTSAIVGGIAAGLVGLAGLIFATMFFLRRWRKRGEEEKEFNPDTFRQSAVLIDDEPAAFGGGRGNGRGGYNPRPPTMIERHIANRTPLDATPMPSLQQYHNMGGGAAAGAAGYGNEYDYPAASQQSFNPGQVMPSPTSPPPPSTQTAMQFFAPYGQSPLTSPGPYDSAYNEHGQLVRQPSNGAAMYNGQGQLSRQDSVGGNAHYVDLDRSSVTPFQAAQYAEISRQLNTKAQGSLNTVNEDGEQAHYVPSHAMSPEDLSNQRSPFADPREAQDLVPPSPIYSMNLPQPSRDRILSNPPKLPEFHAQERTFSPTSYDFPQTPSAIPTPSPTAANFNIPGSQAAERFPSSLMPGAAATVSAHNQTGLAGPDRREMKSLHQRPASTYTVYDEADAYGGI